MSTQPVSTAGTRTIDRREPQPGQVKPAEYRPDFLQATYRGRGFGPGDLWLLFLPGILGVTAPLAYGIWQATIAYGRFGPAAAQRWALPWYALASLALVIFVLLFLYRLQLARRMVSIDQDGLLLRAGLRRKYRISWTDITGIYSGIIQDTLLSRPLRTHYYAALLLKNGRSVPIPASLYELPDLISRLKARLYPRLLPVLRQDFQSAQWVEFGSLAIHRDGLRHRGRVIHWSAIRQLKVEAGQLVVELKTGKPIRLLVSAILSFEILLEIIEQEVLV